MTRIELTPGQILHVVLPGKPHQQSIVLVTLHHPKTNKPVVLPFTVFEYIRYVKEVENSPILYSVETGFGTSLFISGAMNGYIFKMIETTFTVPRTKLIYVPDAYFTDQALATASERLQQHVYKLPWFKSLFTSVTHELILRPEGEPGYAQ